MINTAFAAVEGVAPKGISIHLAPEVLGHVLGIPLTNTLITTWFVLTLVILGAFWAYRKYRFFPSKAQVAIEALIGSAFDYIAETLESKDLARKFFPVIMTIFFFILAMNWVGLVPGVGSIGFYKEGHDAITPFLHPANTDLNVTLALALIAFVTIEFAGIVLLGFLKYGGKFVNFKSPLAFVIGLIELVGEIARLASFSFRLFGNIFAGKTLLVIAIFFVPLFIPIPVLAFEVFVGLIQALVFAVLTLFFIKLAVTEPH